MVSVQDIEATETFKYLVGRTAFLKKVLSNPQSRTNIERYVYQLGANGVHYLDDKNYSEREVKIAKEIFQSRQQPNN